MQPHKIVSREEWIEARKALMAHEKELTRQRDRLGEERRALPWVNVDKPYVFDGASGKVTFADLFKGRPQLVVQHLMFRPDWDYGTTPFYGEELPGISVFYRDEAGDIFHTYSCYARGTDMMNAAYHYLDLTPLGRHEEGLPFPMDWVRLHDQYQP
jgi:predicted dithiol-disulfide oxidoreductase (DUF899 family)